MHTVDVRITLDEGLDANQQETHDGLTEAIKSFESVLDAHVVGWDTGDPALPDGVSPEADEAGEDGTGPITPGL